MNSGINRSFNLYFKKLILLNVSSTSFADKNRFSDDIQARSHSSAAKGKVVCFSTISFKNSILRSTAKWL